MQLSKMINMMPLRNMMISLRKMMMTLPQEMKMPLRKMAMPLREANMPLRKVVMPLRKMVMPLREMTEKRREHRRRAENATGEPPRAVKFALEEEKRIARGKLAVCNLLRCAIQVCKARSAAVHFETEVATASVMGSDVGNIQHSRKSFPKLIETVAKPIDHEISEALSAPLPSTGLPPHWWCTMDKSTPGRETNQSIMICPMVHGERCAIFIDAPPMVYSKLDEDLKDGKSDELAKQVASTLAAQLPSVDKQYWVGVSGDGFTSSNYAAYETTCSMFPTYIKALYDHRDMRHNTDDIFSELEYQVCGDDFAADLVCAIDIMRPVVVEMYRLEEIQPPP
ncbi:hypothetical protein FJT64_010235 [Amphibalanus amphitrite]|uniref:Uncharacterized protein n=1 Tax=Amphibalanus amphitrite TaxID=1232801 RepID=A0A6A4VDF4_AMPAM|nr:hypothetical protein FJT64_010235 [Amphibalanus amphitrite]